MTALLASVLSADEAGLAVRAGVDIVDFKDAGQGALGALPDTVIRRCVAVVAGRRPISATAGDLPMDPGVVAGAVARIGALGVDFVKVGLFPGGDLPGCLDALADQAARGHKVVAVIFADLAPDFAVVRDLAERGFAGVMLDTAGKAGGGLRTHLGEGQLRAFVRRARAHGLFTGLADSLGPADLAPLLPLGPDYLGFRGALTAGGRGAPLDPAAVAALSRAIKGYQPSIDSSATAAAGAQQAAPSRTASAPVTSSAKSR